MDLRNCSSIHHIQAIMGGLVMKTRNVNSHGRPGLMFKTLKEIYEAEDAKKLEPASAPNWQDSDEDLAFECDRAEKEMPCMPLVDRKTRERDPETDEFNGYDDMKDSESDDLNFAKMTLQQLKKRYKTKKRKVSDFSCSGPMHESTDMQLEEDDFDLMKPLSCWKPKLSKSPKSKKKCTEKNISPSSKIVFPVKSEQILFGEDSPHSKGDFCTPITRRTWEPAPEHSEFQNAVCVGDDSSICNKQVGLCGVVSGVILEEAPSSESEYKEPVSFTEQYNGCVVNEASSFDQLEDVECVILGPIGEEFVEIPNEEMTDHQFPVLPVSESKEEGYINQPPCNELFLEIVSPAKDQTSVLCNSSQSCSYLQDNLGQVNSDSLVQVPDVAVDNGLRCHEFNSKGDTCMFQDEFKENLVSNSDLDSEEDKSSTIEKKQPLIFTIADARRNCSNPDNELVVLENVSPTNDKKQPLASVTSNAERNSSSGSHHCDISSELSTSKAKNRDDVELWQPPERLPSTRKAISPTSQERLCLAMNSVELYEGLDHHKCKGKLSFREETDNKASPVDAEGAKLGVNPQGPGQIIPPKASILPKEILKKPKTSKRSCPPKGCLEGPHLSRSLPRLSTGCTSIRGCSESAIAFSQRQMQDIDALAMKLMTELKSMKEIVEQKLLYEAYRNTALKNDADEVKMAIKNASKVEETSRKWLAMMARDCNRFCKILRLTDNDNGGAASENGIQREKRKISFADEAGGMLCHVKVFENGMASMDSKSEKEELQAT